MARSFAVTAWLLPLLALAVPVRSETVEANAPVETKARALLKEWKPRFDQERLNYTVAGPFVIAGDGSPAQLARYRDRTVLAAARALWATYFRQPPKEPVLVLLFES